MGRAKILRGNGFRFVNGGSEFRHLYKYSITDHIRLFVNTFSIAKFNYCAFKFVGGICNSVAKERTSALRCQLHMHRDSCIQALLNIAFLSNTGGVSFDCRSVGAFRHIRHRICFNNDCLAVVFQHDFLTD